MPFHDCNSHVIALLLCLNINLFIYSTLSNTAPYCASGPIQSSLTRKIPISSIKFMLFLNIFSYDYSLWLSHTPGPYLASVAHTSWSIHQMKVKRIAPAPLELRQRKVSTWKQQKKGSSILATAIV